MAKVHKSKKKDILHILTDGKRRSDIFEGKGDVSKVIGYPQSKTNRTILVEGGGGVPKNLQEITDVGANTSNVMSYTEDLSDQYTERSLVDKEYVDNQTEGVSDRVDEVEAQVDALDQAIDNIIEDKADKSTQMIAGTGLTGGGDLSEDRTFDIAPNVVPLTAAIFDGNLNTLTEPGYRYAPAIAQNSLVNNFPIAGWTWSIAVYKSVYLPSTYIHQVLMSSSSSDVSITRVFVRNSRNNGSTWGPWREFADDATVVHRTGNLPETITGIKSFANTVNLPAGTTTQVPTKIPKGVLTTVPQDGAIERDEDGVYITEGAIRKRLATDVDLEKKVNINDGEVVSVVPDITRLIGLLHSEEPAVKDPTRLYIYVD